MKNFINDLDWRQYQNTLVLLLGYSITQVVKDIRFSVVGAINKGTYFETNRDVTNQEIQLIKQQMRKLIDDDVEIESNDSQYTINGFGACFADGCYNNTKLLDLFDLKAYKEGLLLTYPHYLTPEKLIAEEQKKLFEMFEEANEYASISYCPDVDSLNELVENGEITLIMMVQEMTHDTRLTKLADRIAASKKRVVLICGPSSSGKTSFAKRLCQKLEKLKLKTLYMGTDDYYVEKEEMPKGKDGQNDYECIEAIDVKLFQDNINGLIAGETVDAPIFDFESMHKVYGKNYKKVTNDTILVIEGILTLNEKLTDTIADEDKFKIYISPVSCIRNNEYDRLSNTDIRLIRRICRDYRARNTKIERTLELWSKVRDGEEENIFPYIDEADATFNTYCIYEAAVIGQYIIPLLESVKDDSPYYPKAQSLLKRVRAVKGISKELEEEICNNSIIREFIGGSILVD